MSDEEKNFRAVLACVVLVSLGFAIGALAIQSGIPQVPPTPLTAAQALSRDLLKACDRMQSTDSSNCIVGIAPILERLEGHGKPE